MTQLEWNQGTTRSAGVDIAWRRTGVGRTTWVLLHGFGDSGRCWERVSAELASGAGVLALDARNHGRSGTAPGGHEAAVGDVVAVLESFALDRPTVLGHSLGARTAASVAASRPDLVGRLALVDPPWRDIPENFDPDRAVAGGEKMIDTMLAMDYEGLVGVLGSQHGDWDPIDHPAWIESKQQLRREAASDLTPAPWREVAAAIACPTLLITGDAERGAIVTDAVADEVLRNPQISRRHVAGAGHNVHRESFDSFIDALGSFRR